MICKSDRVVLLAKSTSIEMVKATSETVESTVSISLIVVKPKTVGEPLPAYL